MHKIQPISWIYGTMQSSPLTFYSKQKIYLVYQVIFVVLLWFSLNQISYSNWCCAIAPLLIEKAHWMHCTSYSMFIDMIIELESDAMFHSTWWLSTISIVLLYYLWGLAVFMCYRCISKIHIFLVYLYYCCPRKLSTVATSEVEYSSFIVLTIILWTNSVCIPCCHSHTISLHITSHIQNPTESISTSGREHKPPNILNILNFLVFHRISSRKIQKKWDE